MSKQKELIQTISNFLKTALSLKGLSPGETIKKIGSLLIDLLEQKAVKAALIKILGSATIGGFRAKLIAWFVKNIVFDKYLEPLMRDIFSSIGYQFDRIEGRVKIKHLKDAEARGDQDAYDDAVDDILG